MTLVLDVRPYHRLDKFDRLIIDERIKNFLRYAQRVRPQFVRPKVTAPKNDTVSPLPASSVTESEPEVDFLLKTDTEKRTRRNILPGEILAYLRKHGRATNRELAKELGRGHSSVKDATKRMAARGELQEVRFGKQGLLYKMEG